MEGRLRQDRWEKDGKTQSRVRITANAVHFMPRKQNNTAEHEPEPSASSDKLMEAQTAAVTSPEDVAWEE